MEKQAIAAQSRRTGHAPIEVDISFDSVKKALPLIVLAVALVLSLMALIAFRMEAVRLSTNLSGLNKAHGALDVEVEKLKTELAYRVRPDQLEARAALMGLVRQDAEKIIVLDE